MIREREITRRIMHELNATPGCKAIKIIGGMWTETGTPDIIGCYRGKFFAIEVKAPGKVATRIQTRRLWEWNEAGGIAVVTTAVFNIEAFLKEISGKGK